MSVSGDPAKSHWRKELQQLLGRVDQESAVKSSGHNNPIVARGGEGTDMGHGRMGGDA